MALPDPGAHRIGLPRRFIAAGYAVFGAAWAALASLLLLQRPASTPLALQAGLLLMAGAAPAIHLLIAKLWRLSHDRLAEQLRLADERWHLALDGAEMGIWDSDLAARKIHYSPRFKAMLGYADDAYETASANRSWRKWIHPEDLPAVLRGLELHLSGETELFRFQCRVKRRQGDYVWMLIRGKVASRDAAGRPLRVAGTSIDVSKWKAAERALQTSEQIQRTLLNAMPLGMYRVDRHGRVVFCNRYMLDAMGVAREEDIVGRCVYDFADPERREAARARERQVMEDGNPSTVVESYPLPGGDTIRHLEVTRLPHRNGEGRVVGLHVLFRDISEQLRAEERIHHLAKYDLLTDLPNRILLRERLDLALAAAQRNGTHIALLFLDLDRFKNVNDSLGHHYGDKLLAEAARRLVANVGPADTVCRHGGDEFVVLLPQVYTEQHVRQLARQLIAAIDAPFFIDGREVSVSLSIGASLFPEHGADIDSLLRNADTALYAAKDSGRKHFSFYTAEMNSRAAHRLQIETELRRAIERNELYLEYQPQLELATGRMVGAEALVRWRHPERGLVSPGEFIPIAEESGLIVELGSWVMENACRHYARWVAMGLPAGQLAVNVSGHQFRQASFVSQVVDCLKHTGLEASRLELEVTETVIMHGSDLVLQKLHELEGLGLHLAIDDFGTGYSSLSYLKLFPIDRLKIDQAFVRGLPRDEGDAAIVRAITGLGHNLKLEILAEGIETREQLEFLRAIGCHVGQGYYFSRPMSAEACEAYLRLRAEESALKTGT